MKFMNTTKERRLNKDLFDHIDVQTGTDVRYFSDFCILRTLCTFFAFNFLTNAQTTAIFRVQNINTKLGLLKQ